MSEAQRSECPLERVVSPLPWLIGCEESQVVCRSFREAGIEAYSCDLQPTRGNPEWHYQRDVMEVIASRRWGGIILHPDCTAMAVSGNRWYGRGMPRHNERERAIKWTLALWELAKKHSDKVALENPVSVIFQHLNAPVCYVQPYQHGHGETKKTGFALHGLPPLEPTDEVEGREQRVWKMAPSPTRKRDRSETFPGIARAMVLKWANERDVREDGLLVVTGKTKKRLLYQWTDDLRAVVDRARGLREVRSLTILSNRRGQAYSVDGFATIWQKVMGKAVKAGVERFTFNDLRAMAAGLSDRPQELLGHDDARTTNRIYRRAPRKVTPNR